MFSLLADKLQDVFKDLRGHGTITETNVTDAMREVRMALLEADVDFNVAKEFIARVKDKALGEEVLRERDARPADRENFSRRTDDAAGWRCRAAESGEARAHPDGGPERRGQDHLLGEAGEAG